MSVCSGGSSWGGRAGMLYKWADDERVALVRARPLGAGDQGGHALPRKFRILGS